ncbi:unnamed protein product [Vitrella brassicaformis CCMP3155]|uniref:Uncharacterized protein n=2 Tax=Vitrella brassicaformis TaxID=1169539 RepID=A0A0G4ENK2_VITBC|nr:unnamed protein product [Vitrella brassicaformis CCMP3155]|eukprot:CEL99178.1 unnamed protein product [Vitrella brassicaformis CCMP3155]
MANQEKEGTGVKEDGPWAKRWSALLKFCDTHYLPLGLVVFVIFGALVPVPGKWVAGIDGPLPEGLMGQLCVCIVFVLSGIKLQFAEVKEGLSCWRGAVYGTLSILLLTPLAGFGLVFVPLEPPDLSLGLALFALMPMTLTSGVILTKQAEGNTPLALLFTVATNFIAIFTLPATVPLLVDAAQEGGQQESDEGVDVSIDGAGMLLSLTYSILIPLVVGKVLSFWPPVLKFANSHKRLMKHVPAQCIILIVWMKVSGSVAKIAKLDPEMVLAAAAVAIAMHIVFLVLNALSSLLLRLPPPIMKAVVVCASQKTLPVCVTVIEFLPTELGSRGIMVIGAILGHFTQILIDAFLASWWAQRTQRQRRETYAAEPKAPHDATDGKVADATADAVGPPGDVSGCEDSSANREAGHKSNVV